MGGNVLLIILVAALAVYLGSSLERAKRAGQDARMVRQRVARLRAARSKEYLHAIMIVSGSLAVLFMIARWG
jgi:heme exporter protein D